MADKYAVLECPEVLQIVQQCTRPVMIHTRHEPSTFNWSTHSLQRMCRTQLGHLHGLGEDAEEMSMVVCAVVEEESRAGQPADECDITTPIPRMQEPFPLIRVHVSLQQQTPGMALVEWSDGESSPLLGPAQAIRFNGNALPHRLLENCSGAKRHSLVMVWVERQMLRRRVVWRALEAAFPGLVMRRVMEEATRPSA